MSIEHMRKTYTMAGLREQDADSDPLVQFQKWFDEANEPDLPDWFEVNAMVLSTATEDGQVSSRVVLLKRIENQRLQFFTNYRSTKGMQLEQNPKVSLCFFWPHLERQVRIEGGVHKTDRELSEDYFHKRPRESQLGALVSQQSRVIEGRQSLEARYQQLDQEYEGKIVPCPTDWGGYEVDATQFEFWQGRPGRLHDRLCYRRQGDSWVMVRLSP